MTFAEMKSETFRRLQESSTAPVYFTEADIETALNDGYMELSDATEWYERFLTIDLLAARPYYDMRTVLGPHVLAIGPAFNDSTNRWLQPFALREFDAHDDRWEVVVGPAEAVVVRGLWWVGYWPRVGSDSGTVKQYYTALPAAMEADDDTPGFPEVFHDGCIAYAVADLAAQDAETDRALVAWATYLEVEAKLQAYVDGRLSVPQRHGASDATH